MNGTVEARLRKLEASAPAKWVRYVFSATSDPAEWEREIVVLIGSGKASAADALVRVGWLPPPLPRVFKFFSCQREAIDANVRSVIANATSSSLCAAIGIRARFDVICVGSFGIRGGC